MARKKFIFKHTQSREAKEDERKFGLNKQERWYQSLSYLEQEAKTKAAEVQKVLEEEKALKEKAAAEAKKAREEKEAAKAAEKAAKLAEQKAQKEASA